MDDAVGEQADPKIKPGELAVIPKIDKLGLSEDAAPELSIPAAIQDQFINERLRKAAGLAKLLYHAFTKIFELARILKIRIGVPGQVEEGHLGADEANAGRHLFGEPCVHLEGAERDFILNVRRCASDPAWGGVLNATSATGAEIGAADASGVVLQVEESSRTTFAPRSLVAACGSALARLRAADDAYSAATRAAAGVHPLGLAAAADWRRSAAWLASVRRRQLAGELDPVSL